MKAAHVRRGIGVIAASAVLFVGVMGFAHTRWGRPLLGVLGWATGGGVCPLGYDKKATPADREQARARFAATHRGAARADGRPALGFVLDQTHRSEVASFMAARGVACQAATSAADLVCDKVPGQALPAPFRGAPPRELWFNFGAQQQLISLVALSRDPAAQTISAAFTGVTGLLGREAGPATTTTGDGAAPALAAGSLSQASAEFRFTNYYASARATNMGNGFLLTEEYRSLSN
jgi:hypothetical protein